MRGGWSALALAAAVAMGCQADVDVKHEIDLKPIEIKPIYIKIDLNIKIEKELEQVFDFEKTRGVLTERDAADENSRGKIQ